MSRAIGAAYVLWKSFSIARLHALPYFARCMEPERILYFRKRLETLSKEVTEALSASKDSANVVELDTAIGRLSRMDAMQNQQMALELRRRQENQLLRIKNALKRMDQDRYGLCGKCKEPIAEDRLESSPDVVMCVQCA